MEKIDAISAIEAWLEQQGGSRLGGDTIRRLYGQYDFLSGWRLPVQFTSSVRQLDVLLPREFPRDLARIALVDSPRFGTWPHIETDGLLCLPRHLPDERKALDDVRIALADAVALIEDSAAGRNQDDLREEFLSYWNPTATGKRRVFSILGPAAPSRFLLVWRGQSWDVVGDDEAELRQWLSFRNGVSSTRQWSFQRGVFLWLRQPPLPGDYPHTAADVFRLGEVSGGRELLVEAADDLKQRDVLVLLGANGQNGPILAGVGLERPKIVERRNGFRTVPRDLQVSRYFSPAVSIERFAVDRADAAWIHGRDADPRQPILKRRSVVVIGGGSIGGPIAISLSQAGVGNIDIIDPEVLLWGNIGRHPLGSDSVGRNKAEALATRIQRAFPHIQRMAAHPSRWEDVLRRTPTLLQSADVVISALGDWASESALNRWHLSSGRQRPIVYTWTEAHATAGHAIAISNTGGCLRCGFSEVGTPLFRVTNWPHERGLRQEPGCGAVFQPYGPTELLHTIGLATELVLDCLLDAATCSTHRVWAGSERLLAQAGGQWSDAWKQLGRTNGSSVESRNWPHSTGCPDCEAT